MPEHLFFDFDLSPNPKPHILSFKLFGDCGEEKAKRRVIYTWVMVFSIRQWVKETPR